MTDYVYVGVGDWYGAPKDVPTHGLYRMPAGGGAWESLSNGLPDKVEVRAIVIDRESPNEIIVGTQNGPYRSRDGGESWQALPLPGGDPVVWSILRHPHEPDTLFVGTQGTDIFRSRDGGASWQKLDVPVPEGMVQMGFPCRVVRLAIDPNNPDDVYAGLEVGGVVRSRDGGDTWEGCNATLLQFAQQDRLKSRIVSDTENEGMMDSHALTISSASPGTVFLANRMGLFRSDDRGERWQELGIGRYSPLTYARDVTVSPHDPNTMLAALSVAAMSDEGSLYQSRDRGQTWKRFDHDISIESTLMVVAPSVSRPERVYCAARRGQVFGTEDGGVTWSETRLPGGAQGVYAMAAA